jgi:hypothetical protein
LEVDEMGIPITDYSVLKALADGLDKEKRGFGNSFEMEFALEALKEYSVYAFIIHDPNVHTDFHSFFESQFEMLHYNSGKNLAFFGLVDSPQKFCLEGNRPFYSDIRDAFHAYEVTNIDKKQLSYSAFAMANALKIDYDSLPVIVVTNDLRLESFKWFKTCKEKLEIQMSRLSTIANRLDLFKERDYVVLKDRQDDFIELLDKYELNLCNGQGSTKLVESMARALSNIMSFLIETEKNIDYSTKSRVAPDTRKQNYITVDRLINTITVLKTDIEGHKEVLDEREEHPIFRLIEDLSIQLGTYLSLLNRNKENRYTMPLEEKWLEVKSSHLLKTGLDVGSFLTHSDTKQDFSAAAICLAKMFEKELNCSIVHMVRAEHSIELPRYFNEYQPNIDAWVNTGGKYQVNVNGHKNGKWLPPELGKTKNLVKHYFGDKQWKMSGIQNKRDFLFEWDKIHAIRNKAAHTDDVGFENFNQLLKSIQTLSSQRIFEKLYFLKEGYKPKLATH